MSSRPNFQVMLAPPGPRYCARPLGLLLGAALARVQLLGVGLDVEGRAYARKGPLYRREPLGDLGVGCFLHLEHGVLAILIDKEPPRLPRIPLRRKRLPLGEIPVPSLYGLPEYPAHISLPLLMSRRSDSP